MPRRSLNSSSDSSPVTRRTSARIAAAQAASPAKTPVKSSPRRKRRSNEPSQPVLDDTESQQSTTKSEVSIEELNGTETNSSTKDASEVPAKKPKVDTTAENIVDVAAKDGTQVHSTGLEQITTNSDDFELVDKNSIPAADSADVQAAISVQGEDGQLLVGFVQVDKEELPAANSLEIKEAAPTSESENQVTNSVDSILATEPNAEPTARVNGSIDSETGAGASTNISAENEVHQKVPTHDDEPQNQSVALASGDSTTNVIAPEPIPQ